MPNMSNPPKGASAQYVFRMAYAKTAAWGIFFLNNAQLFLAHVERFAWTTSYWLSNPVSASAPHQHHMPWLERVSKSFVGRNGRIAG